METEVRNNRCPYPGMQMGEGDLFFFFFFFLRPVLNKGAEGRLEECD